MIPLNRTPGVRSIGAGKVIVRIVGKVKGWVLKGDVQEVAGPLQTATWLQCGTEPTIYTMEKVFEDDKTEAVILVDATKCKCCVHNPLSFSLTPTEKPHEWYF